MNPNKGLFEDMAQKYAQNQTVEENKNDPNDINSVAHAII